MPEPLPIEAVEWKPEIGLKFEVSDELTPPAGVIGQRRALAALDFGLGIEAEGYNLFVMGDQGSGRRRLVREKLDELAAKRRAPFDWCYVSDFDDERTPDAIRLPRGVGGKFRDRMAQFV
ncbi:MAG TPA: Lon-like protease helical domain-containing protein, partial [Alphaproteobacteria bacterium]|nr:Lon-like protease helical domain-containing protein [Alphaproteobacteria bacterium]